MLVSVVGLQTEEVPAIHFAVSASLDSVSKYISSCWRSISAMIRSIFTSLSSISRLISYLHMPFPYFGSYLSYLSYLHVLSIIPVLISFLLSCTQLVYKPNRYPETNQVCTLGNTAVLSTGSLLRPRSSLRLIYLESAHYLSLACACS